MRQNWIHRLRLTVRGLAIEDEMSLGYAVAHRFNLRVARETKTRFGGLIFRVLRFLRSLLSKMRLRQPRIPAVDFLFYAGSHNQYLALKGTMTALPRNTFLTVYRPFLMRQSELRDHGEISMSFAVSDILIALAIFIVRAPVLFVLLRKRYPPSIRNRVGSFCMAYVYLPAFMRLIAESRCRYVIQSNDHILANRSLRLAAELLGVRNVYMQHASVSQLFPALQYDYAFLDGEISLNVYRECKRAPRKEARESQESRAIVFLSGQKKELHTLPENRVRRYIAIAVNALDEDNCVLELLRSLEFLDVDIVLRTHAGQPQDFVAKVASFVVTRPHVSVHSATEKSLAQFFSNALFLVAGNSSIHLEAAIVGVPTYYFEFSEKNHRPDYYGYVRNGVARPFPLDKVLDGRVDIHQLATVYPNGPAIRMYSATYGTRWQGLEGELVAAALELLDHGDDLSAVFRTHIGGAPYTVYIPSEVSPVFRQHQ